MKNIAKKLFAVQGQIEAIKKDATNPYHNSKYFDVNGLLKVLKPIIQKNGLVVVQTPKVVEGVNTLTTQIIDPDSGEFLEGSMNLPPDNNPQKAGSAITYYRRYALQCMFALEAEDDDANAVSVTPRAKKPTPQAKPQASSGYVNPLAP